MIKHLKWQLDQLDVSSSEPVLMVCTASNLMLAVNSCLNFFIYTKKDHRYKNISFFWKIYVYFLKIQRGRYLYDLQIIVYLWIPKTRPSDWKCERTERMLQCAFDETFCPFIQEMSFCHSIWIKIKKSKRKLWLHFSEVNINIVHICIIWYLIMCQCHLCPQPFDALKLSFQMMRSSEKEK